MESTTATWPSHRSVCSWAFPCLVHPDTSKVRRERTGRQRAGLLVRGDAATRYPPAQVESGFVYVPADGLDPSGCDTLACFTRCVQSADEARLTGHDAASRVRWDAGTPA